MDLLRAAELVEARERGGDRAALAGRTPHRLGAAHANDATTYMNATPPTVVSRVIREGWCAVRLREDVRGREVGEKTREGAEVERERRVRRGDQRRDENSRHGCQGVEGERDERVATAVPGPAHQRHRVQSVGEVVREHGDRDCPADCRADLEGQPDAQPVEERVPDQAGRAERAAEVVVVLAVLGVGRLVHAGGALDDVQEQEAEHERDHEPRHPVGHPAEPEHLGQQVERDEPEQDAGGRSEHEVHAIACPEADDAAGRGREHREDRHEECHVPNPGLIDNDCQSQEPRVTGRPVARASPAATSGTRYPGEIGRGAPGRPSGGGRGRRALGSAGRPS